MQRPALACLAAILVCPISSDAALLIQDYDPARHDRFYSGADKAFIGEGLDFSGVGRVTASVSGSTLNRWVTMITPEYFVSAAHYRPAGGDTVTFRKGNDPSGPSYSFAVAEDFGYLASSPTGARSDLWMGRLSEPIPAEYNVAYYPFSAFVLTGDYIGRELYVYGRDHRVGRNHIDWIGEVTIWDSTSSAATTTVMRYAYNSSAGGDTARVQPGDSGGPSFLVVEGKLVLVGTHYYTVDGIGDNPPASFDAFVPYYGRQLVGVMGGPIHVIPAPEPASLALLAAAVPLLLAPRRLHRRRGGL